MNLTSFMNGLRKRDYNNFAPVMKKLLVFAIILYSLTVTGKSKPNIVFIYAEDLGYGDLGCYGATKLLTQNIDALAKKGLGFTNGHATSSTCTPSRYAMMTGTYAWRTTGTGILPGDAALIISVDKIRYLLFLKKLVMQLYDLKNDIEEKINLAEKNPEKVKALSSLLAKEKSGK